MDCVLALDIGGTKLAAAVVDEHGHIRRRATRATPLQEDADEVLAALLGAADEVRTGDEIACGVGAGGPMSPGGEEVFPLNIPGWRAGFALRQRLVDALGVPTHIDNDAKALALAEGWRGAALGVANYVAMVVSTGVGGGIVLDGRLLDGAAGNAGHIGHLVVEPGGRHCACGGQGCLEAEASGTAVAARTGAPAAQAPLAERQRAGRLVGRAVGALAVVLDLRLAVVAGSVALGFGDDFFRAAQDELTATARIRHARGAEIRPAGLGADGPLVGAAAVAWQREGHRVLGGGPLDPAGEPC